MQTGELIKQQRKLKGLTQKQLADMLGVSEPSIRLYELGKRTPSEAIVQRIAEALDISAEALHSYDTDSAREVLEMLFRLEDDYGLTPNVNGVSHGFVVKGNAPKAKKLFPAIDAWADMRTQLEAGAITKEEYDAWKTSFSTVDYEVVQLGE